MLYWSIWWTIPVAIIKFWSEKNLLLLQVLFPFVDPIVSQHLGERHLYMTLVASGTLFLDMNCYDLFHLGSLSCHLLMNLKLKAFFFIEEKIIKCNDSYRTLKLQWIGWL